MANDDISSYIIIQWKFLWTNQNKGMTHRFFEVPVPGERFRWGDDGSRPDGLALFLMGIQWESILGPLGAKVKIDNAKGCKGMQRVSWVMERSWKINPSFMTSWAGFLVFSSFSERMHDSAHFIIFDVMVSWTSYASSATLHIPPFVLSCTLFSKCSCQKISRCSMWI